MENGTYQILILPASKQRERAIHIAIFTQFHFAKHYSGIDGIVVRG